jgi:hypothetical protein
LRDLQRFRGFDHAQATEESKLDDAALLSVELLEPLERVVEGDEVHQFVLAVWLRDLQASLVAGGILQRIQALHCRAGTALGRLPRARVVDQDVAHQCRGPAIEVRA